MERGEESRKTTKLEPEVAVLEKEETKERQVQGEV